MNTFLSAQQLRHKLIVSGAVIAALIVALYIYSAAMGTTYLAETFGSFRLYHIKAYMFQAEQNVRNIVTLGKWNFSRASSPNYESARSIPILVYHGVLGKADEQNIDVGRFAEQMRALKNAGYETTTLADFQAFLNGTKTLPDRSFLLFFDDGRKDSFYPVDPIIKSLDYHASMAIILNRTKDESSFHLTINELKKMLKSGRWDFASHGKDDHDLYPIDAAGTTGHYLSNLLWLADKNRLETSEEYDARITNDLSDSRHELEQLFGIEAPAFAFPFGDVGQATVNFPDAINRVMPKVQTVYPLAFYEIWRGGGYLTNYPHTGFTLAKRILVKPGWSGDELIERLESVRAKNPSYPAVAPGTVAGWTPDWGKFSIQSDQSLDIAADAGRTGGSVFLDGTYDWNDYQFSAIADWKSGANILLMARYQDSSNYVACSYGSDLIHIQQSLKGDQRIIAGTSSPIGKPPHTGMNIGIRVQGRQVTCLLDGVAKTQTRFLDPSLNVGGIGFKTWDPQPNNSQMTIKSFSVEPVAP
jgi:peptidoglycan/xylan/chitin deacetylase (PgdA/CDA1 family)